MTIESVHEVKQAVERAEREIWRAEQCISEMAGLVAGRLRSARVNRSVLAKLKRELADYNIHTGKWKGQ